MCTYIYIYIYIYTYIGWEISVEVQHAESALLSGKTRHTRGRNWCNIPGVTQTRAAPRGCFASPVGVKLKVDSRAAASGARVVVAAACGASLVVDAASGANVGAAVCGP